MGVSTMVNVGEVMVSEYDYIAQEQAILLQSVSGSFWRGRTALPSGSKLQKMQHDGRSFYCPLMSGYGSGCLVDSNNDLSFDKAYTLNLYGAPVNGDNIDPIPFRKSSGVVQSGFKYELIYQGLEDNVVNVAYREYSQDLARPAFQQDLNYTLQAGNTTVNFRDVRITIHQADNNTIRYTVHSGLE
jgi:hypothetical protein